MLFSGTDLNRNIRIAYFIYLSDGLFLTRTSYPERPYTRVGSILLGANVGNIPQSDLEQPVRLKFLKNPVSMKLHNYCILVSDWYLHSFSIATEC